MRWKAVACEEIGAPASENYHGLRINLNLCNVRSGDQWNKKETSPNYLR